MAGITKRQLNLILGAALVLMTLAVFCRVLWSDFTNYDDQHFVLDNAQVQAGLTLDSIVYAFTTTRTANWHPVTWLSFLLDTQLFGTKAFGYHLTNLLLHAANVILLFLVLVRMTGYQWRSAFVAALFAIHPLHVESVAWVAERKDVLSTLFWLLTMWAYVRYAEFKVQGSRFKVGAYVPVVLFFALGLMSKPMLVTLPFVLLLLDYWPLGRLDADCGLRIAESKRRVRPSTRYSLLVTEKIPLLVLSAMSSVVTYIAQQREGAMASLELYSFTARAGNAVVSYLGYIRKMLIPTNLAVFYPHPGDSLPAWQPFLGILVLSGISYFVIKVARSRPFLGVGWLWYLGTLVPVVGLVQVGSQAMADRYTYIPLVGLFLMLGWGLPEVVASARPTGPTSQPCPTSPILPFSAAAVLIGLVALTWIQVGYWRNSVTLFTHAIRAVPGNALAHNQLGKALEEIGKLSAAESHYAAAVRINPGAPDAHYNFGVILAKQGKFKQAVKEYTAVLELNPNRIAAHNNLGMALMELGRMREAADHFREAVRLDPDFTEARNNLANALAGGGRVGEAIQRYRDAIRRNPNDAVAHYNLGLVLAGQGKTDEAIREYSAAVRIKRDYAKAHLNLGIILAEQGRVGEAVEHFIRVLETEPADPEANNNLGIALASRGDMQAAETHFRAAIKGRPDYAEARYNLGNVLAARGKPDEAIREYTRAVQIKPDYAQAHFNLAVTLFYKARYAEAWDAVHTAQRYGFKPDPGFLQALALKHPEPRE